MATLQAQQAARQLAFAPSGAPRSAALAVRGLRIIAHPLFLPGPPPASVRLLMPHPRSQTGGRNLRYFVQDEKGDGHFFYRAIARGVLGDPELYKEMREAMCVFMLEDANWQGFADFAALQFSGAIGSAAHRAAFYAYMEPHRYGSEHGDEPQHLAFRLMYPATALHIWRKNDIHQSAHLAQKRLRYYVSDASEETSCRGSLTLCLTRLAGASCTATHSAEVHQELHRARSRWATILSYLAENATDSIS